MPLSLHSLLEAGLMMHSAKCDANMDLHCVVEVTLIGVDMHLQRNRECYRVRLGSRQVRQANLEA